MSRKRTSTPETIMSQQQTADYLGVSSKTVERLRKRSRLFYYFVGGQYRYSLERHVAPYLHSTENR